MTNKINENIIINNSNLSLSDIANRCNVIGQTCILGLTNGNWLPPGINNSYPVIFDTCSISDNTVLQYNYSTGKVKIISPYVRSVTVTFNLRVQGTIYAYINTSVKGTMVGDTGYGENIYNRNASISFPVRRNEEIWISVYSAAEGSSIVGASSAWAGCSIVAH